MQQPGGSDRFSEGQAAGGEDDDRPEEVVEIFLCEDAGAEEHDHRDDGHDAHIAENAFELMRHAPERNGGEGDEGDKVLDSGEAIIHWADGDDGGSFPGLKGDEEEDPDEEDGNYADGEGDEEPHQPAGNGVHVLQGDDVLGGGDRGGGAADVGGEGDAEDEGFGEAGLGGEVAEERLNDRETEYRRCNVTDPHACNHCHEHVCEQDGSRFGAGLTQEVGCHELGDVVF